MVDKIKLDRVYISTPVKKEHKFRYDKKNKKRPSWIQVEDVPKGTNWIKIVKNGEAFWYRIYFQNYFFAVKNTPQDYENYYDEISSIYEELVGPQTPKMGKKILNILQKNGINKKTEILELCSGTGNISEILAKNGYNKINLVDISSKELAIAKKKEILSKCKFTKADITNFKPNKKYDVIINSMGLDYFEEEQMKKIFKMISNSLTPKGIFISITLHEHPEYTYYLDKIEGKSFMIQTLDAGKYRFEYFVGKRKNARALKK